MEKQNFNLFTHIKNWFRVDTPVFSTRISLLVSVLIASSGIFFGIIEDSLAVKTNGIIAALDIFNSYLFLSAVNMSTRNPDYVFNYGYGKYESISILASAFMLVLVLGYTSMEAISNFGKTAAEDSNYFILVSYSVFSFILMRVVYRIQKKSSNKYKMPILKYDADLWKTDSFIELGVLATLISGLLLQHFGYRYTGLIVDSVAAVALTLVALKVPLQGSKDAIDQLLDKTIPDKMQMNLMGVVARNFKNFCEFRSIHTRQSGKDIFVEVDIILPFDASMDYKENLEQNIKDQILELYPTSVPRVYATACDRSCIKNSERNCPVEQFRLKKL